MVARAVALAAWGAHVPRATRRRPPLPPLPQRRGRRRYEGLLGARAGRLDPPRADRVRGRSSRWRATWDELPTPLAVAARYVEIGRPELALQALAGLDADPRRTPTRWRLRGCGAAATMKRFDDAAAGRPRRPCRCTGGRGAALPALRGRGRAAATSRPPRPRSSPPSPRIPTTPSCSASTPAVLMRGGALDKAERGARQGRGRVGAGLGRRAHQPRSRWPTCATTTRRPSASRRSCWRSIPSTSQAHRLLGALAANHGDMDDRGGALRHRRARGPERPPDTADAARAAGDMRSAVLAAPTRFVTRYGAIQTWIGAIAVLYAPARDRADARCALVAAAVAWLDLLRLVAGSASPSRRGGAGERPARGPARRARGHAGKPRAAARARRQPP